VTGALGRYRVMADVVGVALLVLVFVGMPLEYGAGTSTLVQVLGPIHGLLYVVYLLAAIDLSRRAQLRWPWMLAMAAAGLVPFVAFIVERRVTDRATEHLTEQLPA
jgi:integral membrane protein